MKFRILNPSLCGKPLGIQQKNIVVTCNYEARSQGVHKLMFVKDAKAVCPSLILANGEDLKKYREFSERIYDSLRTFSPMVEKLGLDENFIDVTDIITINNKEIVGHYFDSIEEDCLCGCKERLAAGSHLSQLMRNRLKEELGITCCAGVAHNKLLAKLAGASHKPNQQTTVFPSSAGALVKSLNSARSLPGIGSSTSKKLESELCIQTVEQLRSADLRQLERVLGPKIAQRIQQLSFGIDNDPVRITDRPKSIGAEDGFPTVRSADIAEIRVKMKRLLERVWDLVKKDGRHPSRVKLTVRRIIQADKPSVRESRQIALDHGPKTTQQEDRILIVLMQLFENMTAGPSSWQVTLLGISFSGLGEQESKGSSIQKYFRTSSETELPPAKRARLLESGDYAGPSSNSIQQGSSSCPPGVDPDVFNELPVDIQKELLATAQPSSSQSSRDSTRQKISGKKKSTPQPNLLNFFRKI